MADYGDRSPDGYYWWDGQQWQLVDQSQTAGGQAAAAAGEAGGQAGDGGDLNQRILAKVGGDASALQGHFENSMAAAENAAMQA